MSVISEQTYIAFNVPEPIRSKINELRSQCVKVWRRDWPIVIGAAGPVVEGQEKSLVIKEVKRVVEQLEPFHESFKRILRFHDHPMIYLEAGDIKPLINLQNRLVASRIALVPSSFLSSPHCSIAWFENDEDADNEMEKVLSGFEMYEKKPGDVDELGVRKGRDATYHIIDALIGQSQQKPFLISSLSVYEILPAGVDILYEGSFA